MKTAPLGTLLQYLPGTAGNFPIPLSARPDLWLRFSTKVEADALLALTIASLTPNAKIVDETGIGENTPITLAEPNQTTRIWSIQGVVTMADGTQAKLDEWVGDLMDRRIQPDWEDRNDMYNPPGGPYLSVRVDNIAFEPAQGNPAELAECEMIWQRKPADVKRAPDGTPIS